ncbi:MAG TPA: hypothetical protein VFI06_12445 [Chitinophagaceae bacterium]|nr:hypothetical protein [Chitinophagaceae bacterium]
MQKPASVPEPKHYLEIRERGIGMITLDKVPNKMVMQQGTNNNGPFFSYKVAFLDSSLQTDRKKQIDIGKYFQYDMYKDWVMLVKGDSVRPVFFQPEIKRITQLDEGVIVFEVPSGIEPDTLLYLDSYGTWGVHQLFLNK